MKSNETDKRVLSKYFILFKLIFVPIYYNINLQFETKIDCLKFSIYQYFKI